MIKIIAKEDETFRNEYREHVLEIVSPFYDELNDELIEMEIEKSYDDFILMEYEQIKSTVKNINSNHFIMKNENLLKDIWKKMNDSYKYLIQRQIRHTKMNVKIVDYFDLRICPYCNKNFIENRGKKASGAQLDHFYPKSIYPLFSMSLFNLVPVCATCNRIKADKIVPISPHNTKYNMSNLKFSFYPQDIDFLNDAKKLDIEMRFLNYSNDEVKKYSNSIQQNIHSMKIDMAYVGENSYIWDIVRKSFIYNDSEIESILTNYPYLFQSKKEILECIYGMGFNLNDYGKKPMSKLTEDIFEELDIL